MRHNLAGRAKLVESLCSWPFFAIWGVLACRTMRTRTGVGVLFLIAFLIASVQGSSSDRPATEPAIVLSQASDQVAIKSTASPPFMLLAKVRLQDGNNFVDGVYAIAWAPRRFRRVFRFPNFTETDVMVDGSIYRKRSTKTTPLMIYELDRLIDSVLAIKPDPKSKLRNIDKVPANLNCISVLRNSSETKICLASATLLPVSIDRSLYGVGSDVLQEHYEFADYQAFGVKQFPRSLSFHGWNSKSVNAQIDKLIKAESFPPDEFVPPVGSTRMQFCEAPEITGDVKPYIGDATAVVLRDTEIAMYFQVDPLGAVRSAEVVYSTNPVMNNEILNWFLGTHFPVRSCDGQAIEYETIVTLAAGEHHPDCRNQALSQLCISSP